MILKIIGLLMMGFSLLILTHFPSKIYQKSMMTSTGIWFGVLMFLIGISLLVFG